MGNIINEHSKVSVLHLKMAFEYLETRQLPFYKEELAIVDSPPESCSTGRFWVRWKGSRTLLCSAEFSQGGFVKYEEGYVTSWTNKEAEIFPE